MIQRILLSPQLSKKGNLLFYLGEILIFMLFYTLISLFTVGVDSGPSNVQFLTVLGFFWGAMWGVICITYYPNYTIKAPLNSEQENDIHLQKSPSYT